MKLFPALVASLLFTKIAFANPFPEPAPASKLSESLLTVDFAGSRVGFAAGASYVQPVFTLGGVAVLAEGFGQKGNENFGGVGGGVLLRKRMQGVGTFGLNGFVESLQDRGGFAYQEAGIGVEYGASWLVLRSNAYLPFDGSNDVIAVADTDGCGCGGHTQELKAATGWDVNLELALPRHPRWLDPRLIVGYYQRFHPNGFGSYSGVQVGTEIHLMRHLTALAEWRQNANRSDQEWVVGMRFEIPIGLCPRGKESGTDIVVSDLGEELLHLPARRNPWPSTLSSSQSNGHGAAGASSPAPITLIFN
jgi:hypothetical protein